MKFFFCIFCILLFISKTENVFSNNLIYDVNNVEVKTTTNISLNNNKLLNIAFKKAFLIFIDKILLKDDAAALYKTKIEVIKDLVFTYQIISKERNNTNETLSIFNVKFDSKKINSFLAKRGMSYADITNISLTLLPILIKDKNVFLYEENFFYKNWIKKKNTEINKNEELISYNLALENIEDLKYINSIKENIDLIDIKKINSFDVEQNYALLIIYSYNSKLKVFIKTSIKNKNINRNINLNYKLNNKNKSYEDAIVVLKKEISQIWKEQNLIDVNTPSFLDFFLEIKKIDDYLKIKSILDKIDIIENYSVLEMTNKYLKMRLKYRGRISKIKRKLTEQNIKIEIIDNIWKLKIK